MKPVTETVTKHSIGDLRRGKRATIADIAAAAGVSKATVSRVLNHKYDVAPETKARITAIIEEFEYTPHILATRLAKGRTGLIGLLMPTLSWPWVLEVVRSAAEAVEQSSYELVTFTASNEKRVRGVFEDVLPAGLVEGMIVILPPKGLKEIRTSYRAGFPLVVIDDRSAHPGIPWIDADGRRGIWQAIDHLCELGHARIAYLGGRKEWYCSTERLQAYRSALESKGIPADGDLILEGDFSEEAGIQAVGRWWQLRQPPSAIFAANDLMAVGVLRALNQRGLRVPEDVALVGFDDLPLAAHVVPALTTVRQPIGEMGRKAVEMVSALIESRNLPQKRVRLETELVVRSSTTGWKDKSEVAERMGHIR